MIRHYLTSFFRRLRRSPLTGALRIGGLAVGLAACFLIGLYVQHETSYDAFHENAERIQRLLVGSEMFASGLAPPESAEALNDYPEVAQTLRVRPQSEIILNGPIPREEEQFYYADSTFFEVFSFELARGNPATALDGPGKIVLTPEAARRHLGRTDVIGETLEVRDRGPLTVTGVTEPIPTNTHLEFSMLASWGTLGEANPKTDLGTDAHTYLLLHDSRDAFSLQEKLDRVAQEGERAAREATGVWYKNGVRFDLQPLTAIHTSSGLGGDVRPPRDPDMLYLFGGIGLLILLIAGGNYVNLTTAQAADRAGEIGIRKTLGARSSQIHGQSILESVGTALVAAVLALALARLSLPWFNGLTGRELALFTSSTAGMVATLFGVGVLTGLTSGLYPGLVLSRFTPTEALTGSDSRPGGGTSVRSVLAGGQFLLAFVLVTGTLAVDRQLEYAESKALGYETEGVLTLPLVGEIARNPATAERELEALNGVREVALGWNLPTRALSRSVTHEGRRLDVRTIPASADYPEALGMELAAGRFFRGSSEQANGAIMLNETAARILGVEDEVGRRVELPFRRDRPRLVGILRDFHTAGLRHPIGPTALYPESRLYRHLIVRLESGRSESLESTLGNLEERWSSLAPTYPFDPTFFDQHLRSLYQDERRLRGAVTAGSGLAVLLACLGLFGLAAYSVRRRTKEIGIRKVLGATASRIIALLSGRYLRLVLVAVTVGTPIAYLAIREWLEGFAFRIPIGPTIFLVGGAVALVSALAAIIYHALSGALQNPARSLRYE